MNPPVASPPTAVDLSLEADRAQQETLELLEWHRVCDHLSGFASTGMGRDAARLQLLPASLAESRTRLAETVEMAVLDDLTEGAQLSRRAEPRAGGVALQQGRGGLR